MNPTAHQQLIESFYEAFGRRDWAKMAACYHTDAAFHDEVFSLEGKRIGAMWHMLLEGAKDLSGGARSVSAEGEEAKARWFAHYTFSATGRRVLNEIKARFRFKDGLIFRHHDEFPFWIWARQALGLPGLLLGWMPRMRQTVQARARANLDKFLKAHPEYSP